MTSTIKVDNIQDQDGNNIINENSNTITIGASGDTVTLASGASQTGFGRTGTVDWQTGSIKTATFTAANGEGYFANTSGGAFTMNLPAGTAGNIVSVVDYTNTFQTNSLTISPNGSQKIGGVAADINLTTEGQSVTFVYVDDTEGWKNVQDSTSNVIGNPFIIATGGTITECGNCRIHTFTGPGTFTVAQISSNCAAENTVSHLVVAGGGGGGGGQGTGGGGAGGYREVKSPTTPFTASPLDGYPSAPNRVTITAQAYPITVGAAGAAGPPDNNVGKGGTGGVSTFSTITSAGGGGGGAGGGSPQPEGDGANGGSGGGGGGRGGTCGGSGNTPPVSPPQGGNGGGSTPSSATPSVDSGGGGGGATQNGAGGTESATGGNGGNGATSSINGTPTTRGGGGGGGSESGSSSSGGPGGGGNGAGGPATGTAGSTNTGGGGGGSGSETNKNKAGGSGIVIIRYKYK